MKMNEWRALVTEMEGTVCKSEKGDSYASSDPKSKTKEILGKPTNFDSDILEQRVLEGRIGVLRRPSRRLPNIRRYRFWRLQKRSKRGGKDEIITAYSGSDPAVA